MDQAASARTSALLDLQHPSYTSLHRLPGYTRQVDVFSALSLRDASRLIRETLLSLDSETLSSLWRSHLEAAISHRRLWNEQADKAALETWGRPFRFGDYSVSGIASAEFSEPRKEALRLHALAWPRHVLLAILYCAAAGCRFETARRRVRALMDASL